MTRPRPKMTRYYMGIPQIVSIYDFFRKIVNFQNVTVFWMFYFCDHFSEFFKSFWLDFMTKQGLMYFLFHISSILLFDIDYSSKWTGPSALWPRVYFDSVF